MDEGLIIKTCNENKPKQLKVWKIFCHILGTIFIACNFLDSSVSLHMQVIFWRIQMGIMTKAYFNLAILTSAMTVLEPPFEIKTMNDVLKYGISIMTSKDSYLERIVKYSRPGTPLYDIYHKDMKNNPKAFLSTGDLFSEVLTNPRSAIFGPGFLVGKNYHKSMIST